MTNTQPGINTRQVTSNINQSVKNTPQVVTNKNNQSSQSSIVSENEVKNTELNIKNSNINNATIVITNRKNKDVRKSFEKNLHFLIHYTQRLVVCFIMEKN